MLKALIAGILLLAWNYPESEMFDPSEFFFAAVVATGPFWCCVALATHEAMEFEDLEQPALEFIVELAWVFVLGGSIAFGVALGSVSLFEIYAISIGDRVFLSGQGVGLLAALFVMIGLTSLISMKKKKA